MLSLLGRIFGRKVVLFCTFRLESSMDDRYLCSKTKTTQWIVWKAYDMTVNWLKLASNYIFLGVCENSSSVWVKNK